MKPTDILGSIKLYNADCMEVMKTFKDKQFDLAIIDPPYGISEDGSKNRTRGKLAAAKNYKGYSGGDKEPPSKEYFNELFRVSQNQIIWGANHFISRMPIDSSCWIVWDKDHGETDFADCELAWTSFNTAVRKFQWRWQGMLQQNMKNKQIRIHPNEKPIQLYKWLLDKYAKEGDRILDTHGGGMSIGIACHDYGFELDICELDEHYFKEATDRLKFHVRQQKLF